MASLVLRRHLSFGPFNYPQRRKYGFFEASPHLLVLTLTARSVELLAPIIVAYPRSARGRSQAKAARRAKRCPAIVQGGGLPEEVVLVDVARVARLSARAGGWTPTTVFQLDVRGELVPVSPRLTPRDPLSGLPTCTPVLGEEREREAHHRTRSGGVCAGAHHSTGPGGCAGCTQHGAR